MSHNGKYEPETPDSEVEPRAVRRHYTTGYKLRILDEIIHATCTFFFNWPGQLV